MEVTAASAAAAAATKPKKAKKKTKTKGRMKAKAKSPRLEGEALRDDLMVREKREEARVLAVNTLFYRARAYNVSAPGAVPQRATRWLAGVLVLSLSLSLSLSLFLSLPLSCAMYVITSLTCCVVGVQPGLTEGALPWSEQKRQRGSSFGFRGRWLSYLVQTRS